MSSALDTQVLSSHKLCLFGIYAIILLLKRTIQQCTLNIAFPIIQARVLNVSILAPFLNIFDQRVDFIDICGPLDD
jgi:hypothetical protein